MITKNVNDPKEAQPEKPVIQEQVAESKPARKSKRQSKEKAEYLKAIEEQKKRVEIELSVAIETEKKDMAEAKSVIDTICKEKDLFCGLIIDRSMMMEVLTTFVNGSDCGASDFEKKQIIKSVEGFISSNDTIRAEYRLYQIDNSENE